jgi:hypothetical protein
VDALPPPPAEVAPAASPAVAPGDIYPRSGHEQELCERASHPDWLYLGGLLVLDAGAVYYDGSGTIQNSSSIAVRFTGPVALGLVWGATLGGGWLALPKCDPHWVGEAPREGDVRAQWPLALSLALLAGATAPIFNGIVAQSVPQSLSTLEQSMHVVAAGVAGFGGALLPFLVPPRTWSAAGELEKIRVGTDGRGGLSVGYVTTF